MKKIICIEVPDYEMKDEVDITMALAIYKIIRFAIDQFKAAGAEQGVITLETEETRNATPTMIIERMTEALGMLASWEVSGEPNTLVALVKKVTERLKGYEESARGTEINRLKISRLDNEPPPTLYCDVCDSELQRESCDRVRPCVNCLTKGTK
jgi:hypothetical protein